MARGGFILMAHFGKLRLRVGLDVEAKGTAPSPSRQPCLESCRRCPIYQSRHRVYLGGRLVVWDPLCCRTHGRSESR